MNIQIILLILFFKITTAADKDDKPVVEDFTKKFLKDANCSQNFDHTKIKYLKNYKDPLLSSPNICDLKDTNSVINLNNFNSKLYSITNNTFTHISFDSLYKIYNKVTCTYDEFLKEYTNESIRVTKVDNISMELYINLICSYDFMLKDLETIDHYKCLMKNVKDLNDKLILLQITSISLEIDEFFKHIKKNENITETTKSYTMKSFLNYCLEHKNDIDDSTDTKKDDIKSTAFKTVDTVLVILGVAATCLQFGFLTWQSFKNK